MIPDFVIAGAPKCGTTSLHHWLHQHPDIHMIRGEPHYHSHDLNYNQPPMPKRRYAALCRQAGDSQLLGERSTWYLYSKAAAKSIHAANPNARILILIRQPAEFLHSLHAHLCQRGGREPLSDLKQALAAEPERRAGRNIPRNSRFREKFLYSELVDYSSGIERFRTAFGTEQVKVITLEALRDNPQKAYTDVLNFLSLDNSFRPEFKILNRCAPTGSKLWRRIWRSGSWRHTVRRLSPLWWQARQLERKQKRREQNASIAPWPKLDPALRAELTQRFEPDIAALEALFDRPLPEWRKMSGR